MTVNPIVELLKAGKTVGLDPKQMLAEAYEQLLEEQRRQRGQPILGIHELHVNFTGVPRAQFCEFGHIMSPDDDECFVCDANFEMWKMEHDW